ncbi:YraN family protein [Aliiroseovarius sp. KMU-50]|uniref:UPF0102 protein O2N63_05050 n=1 Tax=Aliiroseovarius salicola TaxID=3009082 RepID=A0ABT4VYW4_9RHOB|nr:YraN family protein [Aliiroseovarius sp. KMU-50]MDA5093451.1 YraN family protein [Aliiroseovarius sp. KMU-50]
MSGKTSYLAGLAAEKTIEADYVSKGHGIAARRWRGSRGEIDIVATDGDGFIFIEVKKARDFARAAERVSRGQMHRILGAASEFVAKHPKGLLTPMRFDVALVNQSGERRILENAFAY